MMSWADVTHVLNLKTDRPIQAICLSAG